MNTKIQVLRGLAIIAVVMIHTCPSGYAQVWIRPFINWAVPLFLFLSGYLTKMENDNWSSLIRKRVLKVMIPYLLWTLIYTIPNFTPTRFLFNLVSAKGAITLYFIFVYVQMVLLTPAFSKISKPKFGWILFGTVPLLLYASKGITPPPQAQPMLAWIWKISFLLWYPYYLLGLWLGNHVIKSKMALTVLILLSGLSIILQMGEGFFLYRNGLGNPGTQLKITNYISCMCILPIVYRFILSERFQPQLGVFSKIGDYSFGIFLIHILVLKIIKSFTFYETIPFIANSLVVLLISYMLVFAINKILGDKYSKWLGFV